MEELSRLFADFNNADSKHRVRLNTMGTLNDLKERNITLTSGLEVILDDNDGLNIKGVVRFSEEEKIWVAEISWKDIE